MLELDDMAEELVEAGVAPSAAVGFAVRTSSGSDGGWEVRAGGATGAFYDLASLTKPMTAIAVARVAVSGAGAGYAPFGPDARLGDVLEEARGTASEAARIDVLLAHRAGLEGHVPMYAPLLDGREVDRAVALRAAADSRRAGCEGAIPSGGFDALYSDLGYVLVGEALARAVRAVDAGEAIERLVVAPLGRADELGTARALRGRGVGFDGRVEPTEIVAWRGGEIAGAVHDENAWALTRDGGSGHAGMFGTIGALLAFACDAAAFVERPEGAWLVRPWPDGATNRAGFDGKSATASSAGDRAGPRTFGHLGFTGTSFWIDPDAGIVVALLTNRVHPSRDNVSIRKARPEVHDALFALAERERRTNG